MAETLPPGIIIFQASLNGMETDTDGRPLGEMVKSDPNLLAEIKDVVPMELTKCPYHDSPSRYNSEHPMEIDAFRAVYRHREKLWSAFAYFAQKASEETGLPRTALQTFHTAMIFSAQVPGYLLRRGVDPLPERDAIPAYLANLSKGTDGMQGVTYEMLETEHYSPDTTLTPETVLDYSERKGLLFRPLTNRVCAAPNSFILETVRVGLEGEPSNLVATELDELIPDFAAFRDYCFAINPFISEVLLFNNSVNGQLIELYKLHKDAQKSPKKMRQMPFFIRQQMPIYQLFEESLLTTANTKQPAVNQALGRDRAIRQANFRDLRAGLRHHTFPDHLEKLGYKAA